MPKSMFGKGGLTHRVESLPASETPLIDAMVGSHPQASALPRRIEGLVIGNLAGFNGRGKALVTAPGLSSSTPARSSCSVDATHIGARCVLMFEDGDPAFPLILGFLNLDPELSETPQEAILDGQRLVFTAQKEIVFQCGKASITLTKAGKVLIKGEYVLTRANGANRIQGGSVQIN